MLTRVCFTRESRVAACGLREIQFSRCENMDVEVLKFAVQSLKDVNAWDTLERVVVKGCNSLAYDEVLLEIGKERLRYLM